MTDIRAKKAETPLVIDGTSIELGETKDLLLQSSETFMGAPVGMPVRVMRAKQPGPTLFITAAVHGDEMNGTGIVRELFLSPPELSRGSLIMVPVVNVLGLENQTRYLPDRRDLNRNFPGNSRGNMTSRVARMVYEEIVRNSHAGIDLHTAVTGRVNYPHLRADMRVPGISELAHAFGCEVIVNRAGDRRSLRHAATEAGVPTLLLEAGEALKIENGPVAIGVRGILNVLHYLEMAEVELRAPSYQTVVESTRWLRASRGGLLRFHVAPGDLVDRRAPIATIDSLSTWDRSIIRARQDGIIIGMPTLPTVKPGDPICHIATPSTPLADIARKIRREPDSLHRQVQADQATGVKLTTPPRGRS